MTSYAALKPAILEFTLFLDMYSIFPDSDDMIFTRYYPSPVGGRLLHAIMQSHVKKPWDITLEQKIYLIRENPLNQNTGRRHRIKHKNII